jgi:hypothetical protein
MGTPAQGIFNQTPIAIDYWDHNLAPHINNF